MSLQLIQAINTVLKEAGLLEKKADAEWDHLSQMAINAWHTRAKRPLDGGPIVAPHSLSQLPSDLAEKVKAILGRAEEVVSGAVTHVEDLVAEAAGEVKTLIVGEPEDTATDTTDAATETTTETTATEATEPAADATATEATDAPKDAPAADSAAAAE